MTASKRQPKQAAEIQEKDSAPHYPGKGFSIGEYVITDTLGHGAMATVYQARDSTGHDVALKVFQEGPGVSAIMLERFRREAEASKKLRRQSNILTIYATGREGPYHWIAMESIRNSRTLETLLEQAPPSLEETVRALIKIARALQYAHVHNIVHRDIKPANIMINEFGEPLLSDFGVAELIDWPSCTVTGALTGTPLYMSPEQARSERVGPASDIYSLGVVLYEAVTGVLPYSIQHFSPVKDVLEAVKTETPRRPRSFRKEITPELEAVILKALEKNPRDRYVDAEAFAMDLERALAGKRVSAHHFSPFDRLRHLIRRRQRALLIALPLVLLGAAVVVFYHRTLLHSRYEYLSTLAHLKNTLYLQAQTDSGGPTSETPPAWNEVRMARKAMTAGDWKTARDSLNLAADLSAHVGDSRTVAIAQLEQARCETLMGNRESAKKLYGAVLDNSDASPAIAALAQLELLILTLLEGNRQSALEILLIREPPDEGPVRETLNCLGGKTNPRTFSDRINSMPSQFQNDAYCALAVRYQMDGETKQCLISLRHSIQVSIPTSEWPAPFARQLYNNLIR